jgi:hypothetical protein
MKHCETVENIIHNYSFVHVLIIGDFDLSGFPWSDYALCNDKIENIIRQSYLNYLGLKQINNVVNTRNDILELILTKSAIDKICVGCYLTPLIDSYHPPLDFLFSSTVSNDVPEPYNPTVYNFNSCNYSDIISFLSSIDINSNLIGLNTENSVLKFHDILDHCIDIFIPKIKLKLK